MKKLLEYIVSMPGKKIIYLKPQEFLSFYNLVYKGKVMMKEEKKTSERNDTEIS